MRSASFRTSGELVLFHGGSDNTLGQKDHFLTKKCLKEVAFLPILNQVHTCNCGACIEIPNLFLEEEEMVTLRDHHTCGCAACIANLNSLVDRKSIAALREDHTCGCDACTENQKDLAGLGV